MWTLLTFAVVVLSLMGLDAVGRGERPRRGLYAGFMLLAMAPYVLRLAGALSDNLAQPPEWDFMGFWLHARTAVTGANFYDPHQAQSLATAFHFGAAFTREIVDTGFWYPPPSMFLFLPLGTLEPMPALALWYAIHLTATAGVVVLLQRIFLPRGGVAATLACAALVLVSNGTYTTFIFAQTNIVALLAVLVFWRRRESPVGGVWLAVACCVKPFLVMLLLEPLWSGRWRALTGALGAALALMLGSIAVFGRDTFAGYFSRDLVASKPDWIYSEAPTQSLLSLILRLTHAQCSGIECLTHPLFLAIATLIGAATIIIAFRLRRSHPDWALALVLVTALLLYPLSGFSYSVLLLPVLLSTWRYRAQLAGGAWTAALFIALVYALGEFHDGAETVWAFALCWGAIALIGVQLLREPRGIRPGS